MMKVSSAVLLVPLLGLLVLMDQAVAGGSRRSFARHSSRSFALPLVTTNYRSQSAHHLSTPNRPSGLEFLEPDADKIREVQPVNVSDKKRRAYIASFVECGDIPQKDAHVLVFLGQFYLFLIL